MQRTAFSKILLASLLAGASLPAQDDGATALRCGKVYLGNGQVMTDVYMVVKGGKVDRFARTPPKDVAVVDARDKVVMPGIVAADTDLARHRDTSYNVTPHFVALDGFDFLGNYRRPLAGGVTTVYLSPGRTRFVSGQGSVVKLHGDDIVKRVLRESACLRVTLGEEANQSPALFEPTEHPTSDDPLLPARRQFPSARISQLNELRRVFQQAQGAAAGKVQGKGAAEDRYDIQALKDVAGGTLPLRIAAKEAPDARNALKFAEELGARLVLESPYEVEKVLAIHRGKPLQAVFRMPVRPGGSNAGGENRSDKTPRDKPENAVLAARAGAQIALVPGSDADLQDYLLVAGLAIRLGLTEKQAMSAITLDAAKLLGVDARVGSLEPGKDADFLLLSGEPFAVGTMVEDTFVNGRHAFHRDNPADMLVVKAGRIMSLEGPTLEDGAIVVSGGKIKGVSKDPTIPYGARVIEIKDGVVVPGFIDAYCHAGLSGDGTGIPAGRAAHRLTDVIQHDDPVLHTLLGAGLTTVLVSGRDSGTVSGRVAAIKTGAADRASMTLKDIAAIRLVHDNVTPGSISSVEGEINKAKAYIKKWQDYEKALADWKAGKKPAEKKAEEKPKPTPKKETDYITGLWKVETQGLQFPLGFQLDLALKDDNTIGGTMQLAFRGRLMGTPMPLTRGKYQGSDKSFEFAARGGIGRGGSAETVFKGRVDGESLTGTVAMGGGGRRMEGQFTANRTEGMPQARRSSRSTGVRRSKQTKDGSPRKPDIDDNLEPLKALLEKRVPAVVNTTRAPAIREVIDWFAKNELPLILHGARDAVETPEILGKSKPGFLFTPDILARKGQKVRNKAARISEAGYSVGLVSGDTEGARYLPLHAALAVRYGMEPTEALKAITLYPARMFKIDDRVGSLRRGKDADFVVFSGNPLEMTSRILLVVVNGKIVIDNRTDSEGGR